MSNLIPIEHQNQRVLTTQQLAEVFGTDSENINKNFSRNKDRFIEGRDYYFLQGEELQGFKRLLTNSPEPLKFTSQLYLWTERGANRHSKILDTDQAWKQFDILEETYFRVKTGQMQKTDSYMIADPIERAKAWINEQEEKKLLQTENRLLSQQTLTWTNRKVLEALVKAYGASIKMPEVNGFQEAWRDFKKELLYNYSINLNSRISKQMESSGRKTQPKTLDMIHDDELPKCISTAVALCKSHGVDISEILKKYSKPA
jgi:hypothetical protein